MDNIISWQQGVIFFFVVLGNSTAVLTNDFGAHIIKRAI